MTVKPVVLCGGSGTRLWPLSRKAYPKQFLSLAGEETMLQQTVARVCGNRDTAVSDPIVVCNEEHRFLVAEQMRTAGHEHATIMLEPVGRNTAPALTIAALAASRNGEDPVMLVMPADHVIQNQEAFSAAVNEAADLAEQGQIVTFGIVPDAPECGYGYIQRGAGTQGTACELAAFVEKPDMVTANEYLESGDYYWNSGIFMLKASVWLEEIACHRSDIAECCQQAFAAAEVDGDFIRVAAEVFGNCPSDSIDYAVMEKLVQPDSGASHSASVVPLDAQWSDVGAWSAYWQVAPADDDGNVTRGDVITSDTHNSLLMSQNRLIAAVGVEDLVVIETSDAILVAPRDRAQDVRAITDQLKDSGRQEAELHRKVQRPWGAYESMDSGERFQVKRLSVKPGEILSLQKHHHRAEHWIVVSGTARVTCGEKTFLMSENESTYIPIGEVHRLENPGKVPLEIIEVQSGSYLGEDDIVRMEDVYNRVSNS